MDRALRFHARGWCDSRNRRELYGAPAFVRRRAREVDLLVDLRDDEIIVNCSTSAAGSASRLSRYRNLEGGCRISRQPALILEPSKPRALRCEFIITPRSS
jgi:hypothetical protein